MKTFALDHIAITVSNLEKSLHWYSECFGFERVRVFDKPALQVKGATMKLGSFKFEIFAPYEPSKLPEYRKTLESDLKTLGTKHFALNSDDLESAYAYLKKKGVAFLSEPNIGKKSKYVFCQDPDGILIELRQDL